MDMNVFLPMRKSSITESATITCHIQSYNAPICFPVIVPDLGIRFDTTLENPCEEFLERVDRLTLWVENMRGTRVSWQRVSRKKRIPSWP